jgi:hypothetical protein
MSSIKLKRYIFLNVKMSTMNKRKEKRILNKWDLFFPQLETNGKVQNKTKQNQHEGLLLKAAWEGCSV